MGWRGRADGLDGGHFPFTLREEERVVWGLGIGDWGLGVGGLGLLYTGGNRARVPTPPSYCTILP